MDRVKRSELELEAMGLVPSEVRGLVIERDGSCCRMCGRFCSYPALHHVVYRSQGGLDIPGNLVVIGQEYDHDCHLPFAHGPQARMWREYLLAAIELPGRSALQLRRWTERPVGQPVRPELPQP